LSGNNNHALPEGGANLGKTIINNGLNFNPVARFANADNARLDGTNLGLNGDNTFTTFFILKGIHTSGQDFDEIFLMDENNEHAYRIENVGVTSGTARYAFYDNSFPGNSAPGINLGNTLLDVQILSSLHTGTNIIGYSNGKGYNSNATTVGMTANGNYSIGTDVFLSDGNSNGFDLPEVIIYNEALSLVDKQKVDTYLSLKYGITLDQTSATDYLASDGTTKIWDSSVNVTYNKDIFGIGQDDAQALDQRVSKSVNTSAILTLANDNDFTSANNDGARTSLGNNKFLTIANDGGAVTTQTTELDTATYANRVTREWQAQNTGSVGAVNLKFDGFNENYILLTDTDGDFSTTGDQTNVGNLNTNGEIT